MKIIIYLLTFIAVAKSSMGQYENMQLPKFLPPAPNAYQITKSANINVGLHTGTANISIPIFELKIGGQALPIQLNYSSNGVTVDEIASHTGIDWTMNPGGVITRTIMDEDDAKIALKTPPADPYNVNNLAEYVYPMMPMNATGAYNTQPDEYTYNVNNYSGKFFYDHTKTVKQTSITNMKIEKNIINNAPWKFKLTSPEGIIYYFGGPGATEKSKYESYGCARNYYNESTETAWYLTKIEYPNNENVTFSYLPTNFSYVSNVVQTFIAVASAEIGQGTLWGSLQGTSATTCQSKVIQQGVILNSINCSNGAAINFTHVDREDLPGEKAIKEIKQFYNGNLIDRYSLNYTYSNSGNNYEDGYYKSPSIEFGRKRLFLEEIQHLPPNAAIENTKLVYNDINAMPPRLSTAQDHFGYFNGKHNEFYVPTLTTQSNSFSINTDGVGKATINSFKQIVPKDIIGNKEPDFEFAIKGTLQKIIYPTGGGTTLDWEPNDVFKHVDVYPAPVTDQLTALGTCHLPVGTCSTMVKKNYTIGFTQDVKLTGKANKLGDDGIHSSMLIDIYKVANNSLVYSKVLKFNELLDDEVKLDGGNTYRVELTSTTNQIKCDLSIQYAPGSIYSADLNVPIPGLRIKKVTDFDGLKSNIKTYKYCSLEDTTKSSGNIVNVNYFDVFQTHVNWGGICGIAPNDIPCIMGSITNKYNKLQGTSMSKAYLTGSNINYPVVIESLGDNFENGAIEHRYYTSYNSPGQALYGDKISNSPFANNSILNGLEKETTIFSIQNGKFSPVKKTINAYSIDNRNFSWYNGFVVQSKNNSSLIYQFDPPGNEENIKQFDIAMYPRYCSWVHLDSTIDYTYANDKILKTIKVNSYENLANLSPSTQKTFDSNGDSLVKHLKYVQDWNTITGLPANSLAAITQMLAKNIVSPVLEETILEGNKTLMRSRTDYKIWDNNIYMPEILSRNYDNTLPLKPQVRFYKYDNNGNALELAKENDHKKSYVWDYNSTYPIAECSNATFSDIAATSFEADGKGNFNFAGIPATDATAPTGKHVYTLSNGNITKTGLSVAKTYIVSYWSKSSQQTVNVANATKGLTKNGWTLYKHEVVNPVNGTITISGTGTIDELRLYPKEAYMTPQMITYTYDPLIGITSECDANNNISYYQYDKLKRLSHIVDQDKNVIKKICYNYAGQPESCINGIVYYNQELSQAFIKNNCQPGHVGSQVLYTVPANSYGSQTSQADANAQAQNDINTNGQAYANANGICINNITYYNPELSQAFIKNNCQPGYSGSQVLYTVPADKYNSLISQADANAKAYNDIYTNGQAYANINGVCKIICTPQNCIGENKKCVNGICETGQKIITDTWGAGKLWNCAYYYQWSDGSKSQEYIIQSPAPCPVNEF